MDEAAPESAPEVVAHYEDNDEGLRLTRGKGLLEMLRTREIIDRYLPDESLKILDVGGGTGVYALWLAGRGHAVHVVDLVPGHVDKILSRSASSPRVTAEVGDARDLPVSADSFDAALVLGPLYHLTTPDHRLRALAEAGRVVRPGGLIFAAAISRFASLFDGLAEGFLFEPGFKDIVNRDLREGQHRNLTDRPEWFTTAYFHHPDELRDEAEGAGLEVVAIVGVEGFAGWLPQLDVHLDSEEHRQEILFSARVTEGEPTLMGLSAHLIMVARTPR